MSEYEQWLQWMKSKGYELNLTGNQKEFALFCLQYKPELTRMGNMDYVFKRVREYAKQNHDEPGGIEI